MVRSYGQACPVAHALDLIGDRWALIVLRELRLGPRRFADLEATLPGLGPSVLATRLRELEASGVLRRATLPGAAKVYELTEWGAELEPVFGALAAWGMRSPVVPLSGDLTDDSVMLGVRTFGVRGAPGWQASYEVRLARETYTLLVRDGTLAGLSRTPPAEPVDATINTTARTLHALRTGARLPDPIDITGDAAAAQRLLTALSSSPPG